MPLYMQMWTQKGAEETAAFIAKSLRTYVLIGAPVVAGIAAVGPALLTSLASDKYAAAGPLLAWIIAGMVVDGMNAMVGAGLFIHRKTRAIMIIVICCALLNVGLNLVLIPVMGIMGSAVATLASYSGSCWRWDSPGRRLLRVPLPWWTFLRVGGRGGDHVLRARHVLPEQATRDRRRSHCHRRADVWSGDAGHRSGRARDRPQGAGTLPARGRRGRGMSAAAIAKRLVKQTVASAWGGASPARCCASPASSC